MCSLHTDEFGGSYIGLDRGNKPDTYFVDGRRKNPGEYWKPGEKPIKADMQLKDYVSLQYVKVDPEPVQPPRDVEVQP